MSGDPHGGEQLSFFFVWSAEKHAQEADKRMVVRHDKWGPITVYRATKYKVWTVSKWIPVIGPSGRIGACMWYMFPILFDSGREAHRFAQGRTLDNGCSMELATPRIDQCIH